MAPRVTAYTSAGTVGIEVVVTPTKMITKARNQFMNDSIGIGSKSAEVGSATSNSKESKSFSESDILLLEKH
jgi:hypothetical protein